MRIEGRTAVVTGGASGLGGATASEWVGRGGNVLILDLESSKGADVADGLGDAALFGAADVADEDAVTMALDAAAAAFGAVDVCVNCAGIGAAGRTVARDGAPFPLAAFRRVVEVNLIGSFNVLRLAASRMAKNEPNDDEERGVVVNTASGAAFEGQIGQATYSASKGGVVGMTLPIARDLGMLGIRVCTIAPGLFATPMMRGLPAEAQDRIAVGIPFPRRFGNSAEFAHLVMSIVENPMMNGETVRLYIFDCGWLEALDLSLFSLSPEDVPTAEMFVACYLVEHPEGRLLFDGGLAPAVAESAEPVEIPGMRMRLDRTLPEQLADLDLTVESIDFVAFSHLHFDHAGHANLFAHATHLIQRTEHEAAFGETSPVFDQSLSAELEDGETVLLDGDHDIIFGDGRVRLLSTPGHQVLLVDLEQTGKVLLSGDLYHLAASRAKRAVPVFNHDEAQTLASMDRIEEVLEETGATLWIGHDMPQQGALRMAPESYE